MAKKAAFPHEPDRFVIGKQGRDFEPFGYSLLKLSAYMKKTGKTFDQLTEDELKKLK